MAVPPNPPDTAADRLDRMLDRLESHNNRFDRLRRTFPSFKKIVLVLYYYEGMTLAEIGRVLGVTESRISQMHTAAMLRLRTALQESERA